MKVFWIISKLWIGQGLPMCYTIILKHKLMVTSTHTSDGHQLLKKKFNYNYFFNYSVVVKLSS